MTAEHEEEALKIIAFARDELGVELVPWQEWLLVRLLEWRDDMPGRSAGPCCAPDKPHRVTDIPDDGEEHWIAIHDSVLKARAK